ncbi:hypothetical protein [Pseudomonas sp. SCB32]|uniref:hypothetical protein n=1 Tax=Pseudomonas sp. SCB32 TaxID=2653853 RepID=UPI001264CA4A|nr:hypothetical protein [Pseudomonas sp. SCB32]
MAVQQTKGNDLTDRLNSLAKQKGRPSEFEMHALKREIEQVKKANPAEAYMLLGMLYSISGDIEQSIESHQRSIKASGDIVEYMNFGLSLRRLGKSSDSITPLLQAFDASLTADILSELLNAMIYSGDFSKFENVIERFSKANPEHDIAQNKDVKSIMRIRKNLARANIPESEFKIAMGLVESIIVSNGYLPDASVVLPGMFDGVNHVYTEIDIDSPSAEELTRLNNLITEAIIESDLETWDRLIFNVAHAPEEGAPSEAAYVA